MQDEGTGVERGEYDPRFVAIIESSTEAVYMFARSIGVHKRSIVRYANDDTIDQVHVRGRTTSKPRTCDRVHRRWILSETRDRRRDTILQATYKIPYRTNGKHPADRFRKAETTERHY